MNKRVCVIGAGASGIATVQVLADRGVDFDCFELGSGVGGNWRYDNDNGLSGGYASLHLNTSRTITQFEAYPMPADYPDYPDHRRVLAYFEDFIDHFKLRDRITFNTEVLKVEPVTDGDGRYAVTVRPRGGGAEETRRYADVVVCSGHHWQKQWPDPAFPGSESFPGTQIHAHDYRTPEIFEGQRALVLGIGNSGADISVEASRVATKTYLAMRRGAWILPKFILGQPTDVLTDTPLTRAPIGVQKLIVRMLLGLTVGKLTGFGLPKPDHAPLEAHPTVSGELTSRLGHGDITVKPNLDRFEGATAWFTDGSSAEVDVVVYCTGYRVAFPFLSSEVFAVDQNRVSLYRRVVSPEQPGLYFVGLIQPVGSVIPLAEQQALYVADVITGRVSLPSPGAMRAEISAYDAALRKRYVASRRHTIQVDGPAYRRDLLRERRKRAVR